MTGFQKLKPMLEKELSYCEKLLELLTKERAAVISLKQDDIIALNEAKEAIFNQMSTLENDRRALMLDLSGEKPENLEQGIEKQNQIKLSELLRKCEDRRLSNQIESIRDHLKASAEAVKRLSTENQTLIKHSLGLIASTLSIAYSHPESDLPSYGKEGKINGGFVAPTIRSSSFTQSV